MLYLISFLVVLTGCANWLTIGLLQFDFVAGLFGSQSNIFSRIVYVIVGVAAVVLVVNLIKNKGKISFNLKKMKKEPKPQPAAVNNMETSKEYSKTQTEAGKDYTNENSVHEYPNVNNENTQHNIHYNQSTNSNNFDYQQNNSQHNQNNNK